MAGDGAGAAAVVLVVAATTGTRLGATVEVVVGVTGAVVLAVKAVFTTGAKEVEACRPWLAWAAAGPPAKAASVPPPAPISPATTTPAITIRRLMKRQYAPPHNRSSTRRQSLVVTAVCTLQPVDLDEIEAIRQLKYRYFRLLDTKPFTELGALLTEDATTSYQSGELSYQGRAAIVAFLQESLGDGDIVTMHNGHHPEITLTGPTSATGVWYLEDRVVVRAMDFEIVGTLLYDDRYVKVDGQWLIEHTGYERIFEEHRQHSTQKLHSFRAMFDAG
jgi:hypothetical protein